MLAPEIAVDKGNSDAVDSFAFQLVQLIRYSLDVGFAQDLDDLSSGGIRDDGFVTLRYWDFWRYYRLQLSDPFVDLHSVLVCTSCLMWKHYSPLPPHRIGSPACAR